MKEYVRPPRAPGCPNDLRRKPWNPPVFISMVEEIRGLDAAQLTQALRNVGIDVECSGCVSLFFAGHNEPHTCGREGEESCHCAPS